MSNLMIIEEIKELIQNAKRKTINSINYERVLLYWGIGEKIYNEVQQKKERADYGKKLIQKLSKSLEPIYGTGYSVRQLELFRQFYKTFPIANTLYSQLNWSQYKLLIRLKNNDKRDFYINESINNLWNTRQLERQINSSLYERLLLSNEKEKVLAVAKKEILPDSSKDIIKDPMVLEFLGLEKKSNYYEVDLETAIIDNLQDFLLELGNGFAFMARQKRIHINGDDFFIDLVFYNRLLQAFVLFEIKTHKLTHHDIGQLQMYVNYFDRKEKTDLENLTIGILLCADKNDTVVKYTLPEDNKTILASQYELYLPNEKELLRKLKEFKGINDES